MQRERKEEIAANRLQIITPLLDPAMDKAKHQLVKEQISIQYGVHERTLRRWLNLYKTGGFEGLMPQKSSLSGRSKLSDEVIDAAIALRREVPGRSVAEIIRILEWEGLADPGFIKQSTLQDQLAARGYSKRRMLTYAKEVTGARRFQKPWRNYLWQSDIPPCLPLNAKAFCPVLQNLLLYWLIPQ